jgi:GTP cyclohydrolase I
MEIAEEYFKILGGIDFPPETKIRVNKFSKELETKRQYDKFTVFDSDNDEMILINKIKMFSFCEHHLLPFIGYCYIGYIPNGKILGLSKFQRLVDKICSKPTLQEYVTEEIADGVEKILKPKGIGVATTCIHTCMHGRGINTSTINVNAQVLRGKVKESPDVRNEFLMRIRNETVFS